MKYLLYYKDGFIKKFPLDKSTVTLGRGDDNDLMIEDNFLSRKHLRIRLKNDHISIQDLNTTNGTYVDHAQISEAKIKLGDSFTCGGIEFFLRQGSVNEFKPAKELIPIFSKMKSDHEKDFTKTETRDIQDIYSETLKQILQSGLKKKDTGELMIDLSTYIINLNDPGSFFVVSKNEQEFTIHIAIKNRSGSLPILKTILAENHSIFNKKILGEKFQGKDGYFNSYPFEIGDGKAALIYISPIPIEKKNQRVDKFLNALSKEISLLSQLLTWSKREQRECTSGGEIIQFQDKHPVFIVAGNKRMQELIKQTEKIAGSDLFILIQGESGTGKELFARLIHHCSSRKNKKFVALNCAAIPESLLESELFGYDRGAFTGAYKNKAGKLELASGGTLVLDEIGNMSLALQSKLLRALQEYEYYRLGSSIPIKVDLRVISLTNSAIDELLREKKIREDLYYRLAHHIITIPSLRERKEDISALINHFTEIFSRRIHKKINGYAMKAFEVLQDYDWPGNIRQLENEINRLVNLCDDGEVIKFDLISEAVKSPVNPPLNDGFSSSRRFGIDEREYIIRSLEKNNWNKSRTAREMDMTYQGLHKKMKRLDIGKK